MRRLVLARWGEQKAPIGSEGKSSEEGCERLVGVEIGVLDSQGVDARRRGL